MNRAGPAVVAVLAAAGAAGPLHAADLCGRGPLEILLTNDDGYAAPGIRALYAALRAAGHHVRLVAPARNSGGSGMSFTWGTVSVSRDPDDPEIFAVDASPATSVILGATALYPPGRRPDLVVSGINDGANTGATLPLSGTVGAALAGTVLLDPPVPGIAVNAERVRRDEPLDSTPNQQHLEDVAVYVARLLEAARPWFCGGDRVKRPALALNVNYPGREPDQVRGLRVVSAAQASDITVSFEPGADGTYASSVRKTGAAAAQDDDTDLRALADGYVTVSPLRADYTATSNDRRDLQRALRPIRNPPRH